MNGEPPGVRPHRFYTVSMSKLTILYFGTMGFYALFWFYRLWRDVELQTGRTLFPILRAVVAVFFVHELFKLIRRQDDGRDWSGNSMAWFYIFTSILQLLFYVVISQNEWPQFTYFISSVIVLTLQFYVFYQVQLAVNRVAGDAFGDQNKKMTLENQLWMAFGLYIWVSSIWHALNPAEAPSLKDDTETTAELSAPIVFHFQYLDGFFHHGFRADV